MKAGPETVAGKALAEIRKRPGITDRWLAEALFGPGAPQQRVNGICRTLAASGHIIRRNRPDGLIGNYLGDQAAIAAKVETAAVQPAAPLDVFSEDEVKRHLEVWLTSEGWSVQVAWAKSRGVDVLATKGEERWLIEVKGEGSLQPMRVNYFIGMLGELLQRMDDPAARYSIALPDHSQFRGLWSRLPALAKQRTTITALFVRRDGTVEEAAA